MTSDLQNGQSKVDILTRHGIPLVFEDRTFRIRPRTMKHDREWLDQVFDRVVARLASFSAADLTIPSVIAALGDSTPEMLDLIVAYDETSELPPREWMEENAYTAQVTTAFTTLLEVAYAPFAVSRRLLPADRTAQILGALLSYVIDRAASDSSSEPTASPSLSGTIAPPKKSKKPSPMVSSSS
jgi:hypothetical protein